MAKAKLTALTKEWIDNKTDLRNNVKTKKHKNTNTEEKIRQTIYITRAINKKLWYARVEAGTSISAIVEGLVTKHLRNIG